MEGRTNAVEFFEYVDRVDDGSSSSSDEDIASDFKRVVREEGKDRKRKRESRGKEKDNKKRRKGDKKEPVNTDMYVCA